jgi:rubrerythrin
MKKWMIVAVVAIALPLAGGSKTISGSVRQAVERAILNELQAVAHYEACAVRATEEGFPGAASLFKAAAAAEKTHAKRFAKLLEGRGVDFTMPVAAARPVGGTADNLRAAAADETAERDGVYKESIGVCRMAGDDEASKIFDNTRDSEVEHANLFAAAARQLESLRTAKAVHYCDLCGYTTDIRLPMCPVCRAGGDHVHTVE